MAVAAIAVATVGVMLAFAGMGAAESARSGVALVKDAGRDAERGERKLAAGKLDQAGHAFRAGEARLEPWWVGAVGRIPVAGRQVRAARALLRSGSALTTAAGRAARDADLDRVRLVNGTLDTAAVDALEPTLQALVTTLRRVHTDLSAARSPLLLPVLDRSISLLDTHVERALEQGETAALAARVVPGLFGADGPRRYFLAIQTLAELRGSGGLVGSYAKLGAASGRISLDHLGRARELNLAGNPSARRLSGPPDYLARYSRFSPERTWQNVTMSPDFPSVAQVIGSLYPQSGGETIDGVISVDPIGLADVLKLTGPVNVPGWPEPLNSSNAADILMKEQYARFQGDERVDFLGSTAQAIFDRLTTMSLPPPSTVSSTLAAAVRGRHLMLYSAREDEQRLFERIGATGAMPPVRGDFLALVTQNAAGNKVDTFLRRSVDYKATFDPETGAVDAEAAVTLENLAPSSGLPAVVINGTEPSPSKPGENRLYLSLYSSSELKGAELDGNPLLMESARELDRNVYSAYITIPPQGAVSLRLRLSGRVPPGTRYRLDVGRQAISVDDRLHVELRGKGREVTSAGGLRIVDGQAAGDFTLVADRRFDFVVADERRPRDPALDDPLIA